MSFEEVIIQHFDWFKEKLDSVEDMRDNELKILTCCFLGDCLAKSAYPYKPAKERFISLLEDFSQDNNWLRVSLYYLVEDKRYLRFKQEPAIDNFISEKLEWIKDSSRINYCEVDPELSALGKKGQLASPDFMELSRQYRYCAVFYRKYRYSLAYESKILSEFVSDSAGGNRPYYACLKARKSEASNRKRLIFPAGYIIESLKVINQNVKDFMIRENFNPYQRYE